MITLILAHDEAGGIGTDTGLPWGHFPEDMERFRKETLYRPVIMGRKTFESLPSPLKDRTNLVISRNPDWRSAGCQVYSTIEDAILAHNFCAEIFIIGGAEIYNQTLKYATRIVLTKVLGKHKATTFYTPDLRGWTRYSSKDVFSGPSHICTFEEYRKMNPDVVLL